MRLNMYMVAEGIPWAEKRLHFSQQAKEDSLSQPKLYSPDIPLFNRYLYLVKAEEFPEELPTGECFHFVVLAAKGEFASADPCEMIVLNTEHSLFVVFDILQKCFEWYNTWEETLVEILNTDANIQKMCDASKKIFTNPVLAHNGSYEVLGTSVNREVMEKDLAFPFHENVGTYVASPHYIEYFKNAKVFHETMGKTGVENFHADYPRYDVLYVNLTGGEEGFSGRLLLPELYGENSYSTYPPLALLGKVISFALNRRTVMAKGYRRGLERFFYSLLQGSAVNVGEASICLQSKKWSPEDAYCCVLLTLSENERRIFSVSYSCQRLEETLEDCFAFPYKDTIVGICRYEKGAEAFFTVGTAFGSFIRDGFFKAGISDVFTDLYAVQSYYEQAKAALRVGNERDPEIWYYPFKKYAFVYMLYHGMGNLDPKFFVDQRVFSLKTMGKRDEVDYYRTLKVYLENNMNLLHSAEELFIHRTTLFYRINRIKETLGINLSDKETRRSLLMSFYVLDHI
ncbi:MAG TPA: helix-turn-helix domain-containing protein [Clostridiales bacterium]|nr:helix-turn-helix domain-containing protein [Clostridiales bacterium]